MTKKELKIKLSDIINRKQLKYAYLHDLDSNNPTVKELMTRIDAELVAFISVSDALKNKDQMINCY